MTTNSEIALNKYIAHAGYCSRRVATDLIKNGKVRINGIQVKTPFTLVKATDLVTVENNPITPEKKIYILLNKPKNVICTVADENNRKTITDLFAGVFKERLYPIGRLDRSTTGLIIMTNDGDLTQRLAHPKYEVPKMYQVTSETSIAKSVIETLLQGVPLEDGFMKVDEAGYPTSSKKIVNVTIHSGKNHIVRRLFEELGHPDIKLDRFSYAGLTKEKLRTGEWRHLTTQEVAALYQYEEKELVKEPKKINRAKKYYARLG
ncbi:pseudouridine synthase [Candidatus Chromulinivorax destructor]|uniref:Pseudouridine synthase n=1 Tax=Candidatus Chromulinivorax destructor TaxID=2066483 RepID=A0A345ZB54_9BACT|nr:pseudouridine synthase [Candidatus Chromulinivorax destructor]AXK60521.1 rRNA pseudouridine synthase [Candidatus Chromulinivorax destructor]